MSRRAFVACLVATALGGCKSDDAPAYAVDSVWLEPNDDDVHGFVTWAFYSERWAKTTDDRYFVCSLLVELSGSPAIADEACPSCSEAWSVTATAAGTDCAESLAADPAYVGLTRLGIGALDSDLTIDDPHPGQSSGGYADYGDGEWIAHGWAYPEGLETGDPPTDLAWNDEQPFVLQPAWFWSLDGVPAP